MFGFISEPAVAWGGLLRGLRRDTAPQHEDHDGGLRHLCLLVTTHTMACGHEAVGAS